MYSRLLPLNGFSIETPSPNDRVAYSPERRTFSINRTALIPGLLLAMSWGVGCSSGFVLDARKLQILEVTQVPSPCPSSMEVRVPPAKSALTVSYEEPTTNTDGTPLTDLSHTTIYFGPKGGPFKAIQVQAQNPEGGGHVTIENLSVPANQKVEVPTFVCITATDWSKNEGAGRSSQSTP